MPSSAGGWPLRSCRGCRRRPRLRCLARGGGHVEGERGFPTLLQVVLDCTDARALAEFYRQLLGWRYRPGHEEPDPEGDDWLVLQDGAGGRGAFQQVAALPEATWPE